MLARRYLSIGIIVFAVAVERAGYYMFRSQMAYFLRTVFHQSMADVGGMFALFTWVTLLGMLAGGALAFKIGPRMSAIIGFAISIFALLLIAIINGYEIFILLYAFGVGLIKPASYAYAAEVLSREDDDAVLEHAVAPPGLPSPSPRRFFALGAVVCALLAMANAGAAYGPEYGRTLQEKFGLNAVAIGTIVFALIAGAGFLATLWTDPAAKVATPGTHGTPENTAYRTPPSPIAISPTASNGLVIAALATMASTAFVCTTSGPMIANPGPDSYGWISVLETISAFAFFAVFASLASKRSASSLATYYGIGLGGAGVFALISVLPVDGLSYWSAVIAAPFEPLAALGVVFAAIAARGKKMTTIIVAAFFGAQSFGNAQIQAIAQSEPRLVIAVGALFLIGIALAILINARKIQRAYDVGALPTA